MPSPVVIDGIWMCGRFSVGWNFHETRNLRTFALGVAVSMARDRLLVCVGPVTFVWILGEV